MSSITSAKSKEPTRSGNGFQDVPLVDRAKEMVGAAADKVETVASAAAKRADQAAVSAGSNIKNLGETIQEKAPDALSSAAKSVGSTLEAGGKYLEEQGLSGIVDDVAGLIKRNPVPAILVGVGLGVLIARALRS